MKLIIVNLIVPFFLVSDHQFGLSYPRNDEALDVLIQHLRQEGTQPHLWTMLEYSLAKYRRIQASLTPISVALHM